MAPYVLVVESDPDLQRRIGETLREGRYELAVEAEGAWARRSLLVRPPDALVVDTRLGDGSGFAVAAELRRDEDTRAVPIFFVTGGNGRPLGAAAETEAKRRFAPAHVLPSPLDLNTLLARLLEAVPPGEARAGTPPPVTTLGSDVTPPSLFDTPAPLPDPVARHERRHVEQESLAFSGDAALAAELSGRLAEQPFARVLQRIYARRLSGRLLIAHADRKKIITFNGGYPLSIRSNVLDECLGRWLLLQASISREALDESVARMRREKRPQGAILVEMGALSPYRLSRALVEQMEAKLFDLFSWTDGVFAFKPDEAGAPGAADHPEAPHLDRSTAALILEGIRRHYGPERIEAVLAPFAGRVVVRSRDPLQRLQDLSAEPNEQQFVEAVDGRTTLESLLGRTRLPEVRAKRLLVAMAEAGMIEPGEAPGEVRADEPARGPAPLPGPPKSRSELAAIAEAKNAQSLFDVLGVAADASDEEIEAAYESLAREFHPDRYRTRSEGVRTQAQRIFERVVEARTTLLDPARRTSYAAQTARARGSSRPAPQDGQSGVAAEQIYYAGVEHLRARRYGEAANAFRQAAALAPEHANYHAALGWALYRQAPADPVAVDAGLAALRRAVSLDDQDAWLHVSLGRYHAETGRPDEAIASFQAALRLHPGLPDVVDELRRLQPGYGGDDGGGSA